VRLQLFGTSQEFGNRIGRLPALQHGSKDRIRIGFRARFSQALLVIDPGIDDYFSLGREAKEQPVPAVKLGPEPMAVTRTQRIALPELRTVRIAWNSFQDVVIDGGQNFGRGV
jgi:hypothetical protein